MSLRVEVDSAQTTEFKGVSRNTGKDFCFHKQTAFVFMPGQRFPEKIEISHDSPSHALPVGTYKVDIEHAVAVDRFGGLGIDSRKLMFTPVERKDPASATASAATTVQAK